MINDDKINEQEAIEAERKCKEALALVQEDIKNNLDMAQRADDNIKMLTDNIAKIRERQQKELNELNGYLTAACNLKNTAMILLNKLQHDLVERQKELHDASARLKTIREGLDSQD